MKVSASTRGVQGTGASRRLRRAGKVPGIIYGGKANPIGIELDHNDLFHALRKEAFHSSILDLEVEGKSEKVLLRDVQWHAYKPQVLHVDFQRVAADQKIHVKVPLHFLNAEHSPAVKLAHALVSHVLTELEVTCLPGALPEFIEVDLKDLQGGQSVHVNDLKLPEGVTPLLHGQDNPAVATAIVKGGGATEEAAAEPAAAAAPAAAPAAKK
jgi:large subunit ribosomal protein L25